MVCVNSINVSLSIKVFQIAVLSIDPKINRAGHHEC